MRTSPPAVSVCVTHTGSAFVGGSGNCLNGAVMRSPVRGHVAAFMRVSPAIVLSHSAMNQPSGSS